MSLFHSLTKFVQRLRQCGVHVTDGLCKQFVEWLQDELNKGPLGVSPRGLLGEGASVEGIRGGEGRGEEGREGRGGAEER